MQQSQLITIERVIEMGNPLFNMLGGGMPQNPMAKMIQDYKKFREDMQGKNPQEEVNKLLQSGKVNQNQLNQIQQMAQQMSRFFK